MSHKSRVLTQEEKELVMLDISSRLSFGVIVQQSPLHSQDEIGDPFEKVPHDYKIIGVKGSNTLITDESITKHTYAKGYVTEPVSITIQDGLTHQISLPYLRPMSSMTAEEKEYTQQCIDIVTDENYGDGYSPSAWGAMNDFVKYCDSHHLDHRGLIWRELALQAPEDMYND